MKNKSDNMIIKDNDIYNLKYYLGGFMSYSSEQTRRRILESAKNEFLSKSFLNANLKTIAENAKVTTGALYRHFKGKDELFYALFKEEFEFMSSAISNTETDASVSRVKNLISEDEIEASIISMTNFIDYIYQHIDAFKLMFLCAEGSQYSGIKESLVDLYSERSFRFFCELYENKIIKHIPQKFEIHFISDVFFSATIECIYQNLTYEEAKKHIRSFVTYHQYGCYGMMDIVE